MDNEPSEEFSGFASEDERRENIRQFWIDVWKMPPEFTYEQGVEWCNEQKAKDEAWRKMINRKERAFEDVIESRCRARMLEAGFAEDELIHGRFARCLPGNVSPDDPRLPAFLDAVQKMRDDEAVRDERLRDPNWHGPENFPS